MMMETETRFEDWHEFLNNASLCVHLVGADGKILWANKPELALLGYAPEEYYNRHIADFHADKDVIHQILNILLGGGMLLSYPARLRAKDGSIKYVLINSNVFRIDGQFAHTRCFSSCISEFVYETLRKDLLRTHRGE